MPKNKSKATTAGQRSKTEGESPLHTIEVDLISELPTPSHIRPKYLLSQKGLPVSRHQKRFLQPNLLYTTEHEAFTILLDLLNLITHGNNRRMAALMGCSIPTIMKWKKGDHPKQWYWPYVAYMAIRSNYHTWKDSIKVGARRTAKWNKTIRAIEVIVFGDKPVPRTGEEAYTPLPLSFRQGVAYFRRGRMDVDREDFSKPIARQLIIECARDYRVELKDFALRHGTSTKNVRRAADNLGMVKEQAGFGEDKEAYYRLPPEWGLDFEGSRHDEDDEPELDIGRPQYRKLTKRQIKRLVEEAKEQANEGA